MTDNFVDQDLALPDDKINTSGNADALPNPTRKWSANDADRVFSSLRDLRTVAQRAPLNVKARGAVGDGVHDDSTAILATIAEVAADGGGTVDMSAGTYLSSSQIVGADAVLLRGDRFGRTVIRASNTFNAASLITNASHDGTQEFFGIEGILIDGNQAGGAVCSVAVVDLVSLFINSYFRDIIILNGSGVGLRVAATNAMGPLLFENVWLANNVGHNLLCEEVAGNSGACDGLCFVNLTSEHQGSGKSAIYLKGLGSCAGWNFFNTHVEQGQVGATTQTCITIDGVPDVLFDGVQLLTGNVAAMTAGIAITTAVQNVRIQIRGVTNANLINPVIADAKNSVTIGAISPPWYVTPEVNVRGGLRFTPDSAAAAKSLVLQDSGGADRVWGDKNGRLTGASVFGAGVEIVSPDSNERPLALTNLALNQLVGWVFQPGGALRLRNLTNAVDGYELTTAGLIKVIQALQGTGARAAAPSTGTHIAGEIVLNADPVAGGKAGWICVTGGTPGTWKAFGAIDA
jgi:hypothetical protein